jgi:predicted nucleic acid-binding protein
MPIAGVVADANVLLSAVVRKAALRIFTEFKVVVHVTEFNADEVAEYLPHKRRDPEDAHALALARSLTLPIWSNDRDLSGLDVESYTTRVFCVSLMNRKAIAVIKESTIE